MPCFFIQSACTSFCRRLASLQSSGVSPALVRAISSRLLRCLGTGTIAALTIWPSRTVNPVLSIWVNYSAKRLPTSSSLFQLFAKYPDRLGIRYTALRAQSKKPAEAVTITDLKLGLIVREVVKVLQHQYLEHQDRVKGWTPTLAGITFLIDPAEQFAKSLPLDSAFQFRHGIAEALKQFKAVLMIKEAGVHGCSEDKCAKAILSLIWVSF